MKPDSFEARLKRLSPGKRECFDLIEQALARPANETVERALQLARVACLGEGMWSKEVQS
jgi:hypothetical protein